MAEPLPIPSTPEAGRRYGAIRHRLLLIDLAVSLLFLAAFQWTGWSHQTAAWWARRTAQPALLILGYLAVFGSAAYAVSFPTHFYGSYVLEHRFGLSRLSIRGWLVREVKHLGINSIFGILLVEGFYLILRHAPESWPLWATVAWVGLSVVLARLFPTVLLPLFYRTTPLNHPELADRLLRLCRKAGQPALGVFRFELGAETRKANAALAGLGKTRRVLLSDTLVQEFTPDEIEGVLAHELAHHRYHHITKMLVISAVGSWIALSLINLAAGRWIELLGLAGLEDIAGLPVLALALSLLGLISMPLQNGLSRHFEWQCDRFAVATTPAPAFASALRRLAGLNLSDPNPPKWVSWMFYDHPPMTERIQAAERAAA